MHYVRVRSESELRERLTAPDAVILAGGTDLMVRIHSGAPAPACLVDISRLDALRSIGVDADRVRIGAAVPCSDLLASDPVREHLPLLTGVLRRLGSVQIRNRATLGGNLANASPAADSAIPLLLYDAELSLAGPGGTRIVPIGSFFTGPGRTVLRQGEYIREISIPIPAEPPCGFFHKVGRRRALTIAIASVGALVVLEAGRVIAVRLAAGSVAPTPLRLRGLEDALVGRPLTEEQIAAARTAAAAEIAPISDVRATADYRRTVVSELVARALRRVLEGAPTRR